MLRMVEGMMIEEKVYEMVGLKSEVKKEVKCYQLHRWFRHRLRFVSVDSHKN